MVRSNRNSGHSITAGHLTSTVTLSTPGINGYWQTLKES